MVIIFIQLTIVYGRKRPDIKWKQRFYNFKKAFRKFEEAVSQCGVNPTDMIREATIQRFEFTHELAWKVMKVFLLSKGINRIGSKDATREAFRNHLISDGQIWMDMIENRNI